MALLCRVAENLFWLSRYVERAVAVIRLIDVTAHLELDAGDAEADADDSGAGASLDTVDFWTPLLGPADEGGYLAGDWAQGPPAPSDVRHHLAFDADNPSSLIACVRRARAAAREVRDSISSEMWEQINTVYLALGDPRTATEVEENLHAFYRRVRDGLLLTQGLTDATVAHDEPWCFLTLGTHLERADNLSRALTLQSRLLASGPASRYGDDTVRWLAVLRSAGSAEAYARYYSLRVEPPRVLEFLLLNPSFPQSVRYSLGAAWQALEVITRSADTRSGDVGASPPVRALGRLRARLEHASVDEVLEYGLKEFLREVQAGIAQVSEQVTRTYFRYEPQVGRHMAVARAAQIMAAQQQ